MSKKGVKKMSLGEFIGDAAPTSALPTAPRERAPDDDGSFRRYSRDDERPDREQSRSEQDTSWRRGGGAGGGGDDRGGGFRGGGGGGGGGYDRGDRGGGDDRGNWRGGGGAPREDRGDDRGGGGGNWRGGGGARGGGGDDRSGGGGGNWRGGGGDRADDRGGDRGGGGGNWRGGGDRQDDRGGDRGGGGWRGGGAGGQRDDRGGSWRGGGGGGGGFDRSDDRGGRGDDRGGRGDDRGGSWRGGGASARSGAAAEPGAPTGERPRLQLKQRTVAGKEENAGHVVPEVKPNSWTANSQAETASKLGKLSIEKEASPEEPSLDPANENSAEVDEKKRERKVREPEVVNSRAAAMGLASDSHRDRESNRRDHGERGPPPVLNKRFEQLADEEREKNRERSTRNAGPPPVANSRFAAAAESDRSNPSDSGPPPVANSRFAAAAEADRSFRDDRGPPPVANSRFAAAAEADRSVRNDRGPPPVANSRFAAAAAMAEKDSAGQDDRRRFNRDDERRPIPQNSRFAAAAAADGDYVDRDRRGMDRNRDDDRGRFGGRNDDFDRRGDGGRNPQYDSKPRDPPKSRVDDLLKPKAPPVVENILKPPVKLAPEHEENVLKVPVKANTPDTKKQTPVKSVPKSEEVAPPPAVSVPVSQQNELLKEFASGEKLGDDLKAWCDEHKGILPQIDRLVYSLLMEREKLNPDVECAWAEPSKYGAALLSLVEDDVYAQMQVLWGIQLYCDKLGFPKLNDEYVVQAMFRSMYKFDLVADEAFFEWKEDESDAYEAGKMKAIIQTVDWFTWLEQEEEEEEEEDEDAIVE